MYTFILFLLLLSQNIFTESNANCTIPTKNFVYNPYDKYYTYTLHSNCEYFMINNPKQYNLEPNYDNIENVDVLPKTVFVTIDSSLIPIIDQDTFKGVTNINKFQIEKSHVAKIEPNAFVNFTELHELKLNYNNITELRNGAFSTLNQLKRLKLSNNKINTIDELVFENLESLQELDLSFNEMSTLNNSLNNLKSLEVINLKYNKLTKLESFSFQNMDYLSYIYLYFNEINLIEEYAFTNLIRINFIDFSDNQINTIKPNSFNMLPNFNSINLNNNNITNVAWLQTIPSLKYLYLHNNSITEIGILKLKYLHLFDLSKNKIQTLQVGAFNYMKNLAGLYLSENKITKINTGTFSGLKWLENLNLNQNHLKTISGYPFYNSDIRNLDISGNELTNLDVSGLTNVRKLYLHNNNFTCPVLYEIINNLTRANVSVENGNSFETSNINGISCKEKEEVDEDLFKNLTENNQQFLEYLNYLNATLENTRDSKSGLESIRNALSENNQSFLEYLNYLKNLTNATLENNRVSKSGFEIIRNALEENNQKFLDLVGMKEVMGILNQTKNAEQIHFERLFKMLKNFKTRENENDKKINVLNELMKQNVDNTHTLITTGGICILMIGIFMAIYIYFKYNDHKRKFLKENCEYIPVNEMKPLN